MNSQNKLPASKFKRYFYTLLIWLLPVQQPNNFFVLKMQPLLLQIVNTIVLNFIIFKLIFPNIFNTYLIPSQTQIYIIGIRIALCIAYILLKQAIIFTVNRITVLLQLILTSLILSPLNVITLLIELITFTIIVLKKQKRINNINSKLTIFPMFLKELCFFLVLGLILSDQSASVEQLSEKIFILIIFLIFRLILTCQQIYYKLSIKKRVKLMDIWILLISIFSVIAKYIFFTQMSYIIILILDIAILAGIIIMNTIFVDQYSLIYKANTKNFQSLSENVLIEYFIELIEFSEKASMQEFQLFKSIHKTQCQDPQCIFNYQMTGSVKKQDLNRMMKHFIEKQLKLVVKGKKLLKDLLIFMLSPSQKIYDFLDPQQYFNLRQIIRIEKDGSIINDCDIQKKKFQEKDDQIKQKMAIYIKQGFNFWKYLLLPKINILDIINSGFPMMKIYKDLLKMSNDNNKNFLEGTRQLMQNFLLSVNNKKKLQQIKNPLFIFKGITQNLPALVIGAQKQQFTKVLDANNSMVKAVYYSKQILCSLKIEHLVPPQIAEEHMKLISERSRRVVFDIKKNFDSTVYVKNKLGYIVPGSAVTYGHYAISGNKWVLIFNPRYVTQAIMIVYTNGKILGVNQNAIKMGFQSEVYGQYLKDEIFQNLIILKNNNKFFLNKSQNPFKSNSSKGYKHSKNVIFRRKQDVEYFLMKYYIIQILEDKKQQNLNKKAISSQSNKVSFSFYRDFNGCIKNSKAQLKIFQDPYVTDQQLRQKNVRGLKELSEQILEMRYFKGKLDSVQNMDVQTDFMDPPKALKKEKQRPRNKISESHYQQTQSLRKNKSSRKIWVLRISFAIFLIVIAIIGSFIFGFTKFNVQQQKKQLNYMNLYCTSFFYTVLQGNAILARRLKLSINATQLIDNLSNDIRDISLKLRDESFLGNQQSFLIQVEGEPSMLLSRAQSDFILLINQFTSNQQLQYSKAQMFLSKYLYIGKLNFLAELLKNYQNKNFNRIKIILLSFGLMILIFALFFIFLTFYFLRNLKIQIKKVISILSKIHQEHLFKILNRLKKLEKSLMFNVNYDIGEEKRSSLNIFSKKDNMQWSRPKLSLDKNPELEKQFQNFENKQKQYQQQSPKILNGQISDILFYCIFAIWSLICLGITFIMFCYQFQIISIHENNLKANKYLAETYTAGIMTWTGVNQFPNEIQKIDAVEDQFYQGEVNFSYQLFEGLKKNYFSDQFNVFYNSYQNQNVCQYLNLTKLPNCRTDLLGSLNQGTSQVIAFLNRKLDYLMHHGFEQSIFYSLSVVQIVGDLITKYFYDLQGILAFRLLNQGKVKLNQYEQQIIGVYASFIVAVFLGGLIYFYLVWKQQERKRIEQILQIVPFEFLSTVNQFHEYVFAKNQEIY